MNLKNILKILLSLQLALMPLANANDGLDFDFSDEPDYVYSGDDDSVGDEDGNCSGAGCGDDYAGYDSDDRSGFESPDRDEGGELDHGGHSGGIGGFDRETSEHKDVSV